MAVVVEPNPLAGDDGLSLEEAAYLSGGSERISDTMLVQLFRAGQLSLRNIYRPRVHGPRLQAKGPAPPDQDGLAYRVYRIAQAGGTVQDARLALELPASAMRRDLIRRGLLFGAREQRRRRIAYAVVGLAAIGPTVLGPYLHQPISSLAGFVVMLAAVWLWSASHIRGCGAFAPPLTRAGRRALLHVRRTWQTRGQPPIKADGPLGWAWTCALYGVRALPNTPTADRLKAALLYNKRDLWRPHVGGSDSTGDGVGEGGGCGGAGCGGCGG